MESIMMKGLELEKIWDRLYKREITYPCRGVEYCRDSNNSSLVKIICKSNDVVVFEFCCRSCGGCYSVEVLTTTMIREYKECGGSKWFPLFTYGRYYEGNNVEVIGVKCFDEILKEILSSDLSVWRVLWKKIIRKVLLV